MTIIIVSFSQVFVLKSKSRLDLETEIAFKAVNARKVYFWTVIQKQIGIYTVFVSEFKLSHISKQSE